MCDFPPFQFSKDPSTTLRLPAAPNTLSLCQERAVRGVGAAISAAYEHGSSILRNKHKQLACVETRFSCSTATTEDRKQNPWKIVLLG